MNADWATPESGEVQVVVGSLTDENLKRLFFAELQNPNWLEPLAALGVFATEPEAWVDDAGLRRPRPWPEGEYLARVAADEPAAVTGLLVGHAASENPWVHRVVLDAALAVPAQQAARLVPQIIKALRPGSDWVDASKVLNLAEALAPSHLKQARALLTGAFEPKAGGEEGPVLGTRTRVVSLIDSFWFRELAPRVAALLDIVRDTAAQVAKAGHLREVIDFLEARNRYLLARIAVETTAQVVAADPSAGAIDTARILLNKEALLDLDARPEYVHLALAAIPHLSTEDVTAWQEVIDAQAWQGSDDVTRRMKYRLLLPLGPVLPAGLTAELAELKAEFGEMEHPEFGSYMTSAFIGPTSPLDHDALGAMSPGDLRTFLATWQPEDDHHFGPSPEGLARELEIVAENRPELLAALAGDL